jgi:hypothetical protein
LRNGVARLTAAMKNTTPASWRAAISYQNALALTHPQIGNLSISLVFCHLHRWSSANLGIIGLLPECPLGHPPRPPLPDTQAPAFWPL